MLWGFDSLPVTASSPLWPSRQLPVDQELVLWCCLMTLLSIDQADVQDDTAEMDSGHHRHKEIHLTHNHTMGIGRRLNLTLP